MLIFRRNVPVMQSGSSLDPPIIVDRIGEESIAELSADVRRPFLLRKEIKAGIQLRAEGVVLTGEDIEVLVTAGQIRSPEIIGIIDTETDGEIGIELIPSEQVESV